MDLRDGKLAGRMLSLISPVSGVESLSLFTLLFPASSASINFRLEPLSAGMLRSGRVAEDCCSTVVCCLWVESCRVETESSSQVDMECVKRRREAGSCERVLKDGKTGAVQRFQPRQATFAHSLVPSVALLLAQLCPKHSFALCRSFAPSVVLSSPQLCSSAALHPAQLCPHRNFAPAQLFPRRIYAVLPYPAASQLCSRRTACELGQMARKVVDGRLLGNTCSAAHGVARLDSRIGSTTFIHSHRS